MTTRIFKNHKCKNSTCNNLAEKDKYGLYRSYCSDECNPRKRPRICNAENCTNQQPKNSYGNYIAYCSTKCSSDSFKLKHKATSQNRTIEEKSVILTKRISTVQEIYGVDNVAKDPDIRALLKQTTKASAPQRLIATQINNKIRYGVESTNSLQSVKDTKKSSFMVKYGVDHQLKIPEIAASVSKKNTENSVERLALAKITKEELYGDENYNNRPKYKATCLKLFGVENPSQNAAVHTKQMSSMYRSYSYTLPSGKVIVIMGYEDRAIVELLKTYHEDDLVFGASNVPNIPYKWTDGSQHMYFPDVYIPKDNLIIEVKSQYTYNGFIGWFVINKLKEQACIDAGFNFKFMIMKKLKAT